jgi:hypothetical protein
MEEITNNDDYPIVKLGKMLLNYELSKINIKVFADMNNYFGDALTISLALRTLDNAMVAHQLMDVNINSSKYLTIGEAFKNVNTSTNILAYIEELDLYVVFNTLHDFKVFLARFNVECNRGIKMMPYQIVLSNIKQKIVFGISGSDNEMNEIKKYCKDFFKTELISTKNGNKEQVIPIVPLVSNYNEVIMTVKRLYEFIAIKNKHLAENVIILHEHVAEGINFTRRLIYYDEDIHKGYTINDFLHTTDFDKKTEEEIIPVNKIIRVDKRAEIMNNAIKWIIENPPFERELKWDYWIKYIHDNTENISIQMFNKYIRENTKAREIVFRKKKCWTYDEKKSKLS